jgi:serine-type D-Ala-D-Ala endopeptidase (penicillin-binding protein 7)
MNQCRSHGLLTLIFSLLAGIAVSQVALSAPPATPQAPDVRSQAVLVLDDANGSVIYSRKAADAGPIASITKLMTALVVLDGRQSLDEQVEITAVDRVRTQNLSSRLPVGTRLTRREMLQLALMSSENRAAQALARSYPGGEVAILDRMNTKARELGMTRSHFQDATGLSEKNVASPDDLARLVKAANDNALIREYSTAPARTVLIGRQQVEFRNTDSLVHDPGWQISVQKTGHIAAAGHCLVLHAQIEGRAIVMVLMNSVGKYTRVADARRIRRWMAAVAASAGVARPAS